MHGAGANKNYWKSLSASLLPNQVFLPDLYGHGETAPWRSVPRNELNYSYKDEVPLIEVSMSQTQGPVDLVGHSSGGAVCLEYAIKHPNRIHRLVLVEPMLPTILKGIDSQAWGNLSQAYEQVHCLVKEGKNFRAARDLFEYILGDGQWDLLSEKIQNWMALNVETTLAAHSRASLDLPTDVNTYAQLECPVLFLYGEKTRKPYKRICEILADKIPGSQITCIKGASHNSPLTHAEIVNSTIRKFLNA